MFSRLSLLTSILLLVRSVVAQTQGCPYCLVLGLELSPPLSPECIAGDPAVTEIIAEDSGCGRSWDAFCIVKYNDCYNEACGAEKQQYIDAIVETGGPEGRPLDRDQILKECVSTAPSTSPTFPPTFTISPGPTPRPTFFPTRKPATPPPTPRPTPSPTACPPGKGGKKGGYYGGKGGKKGGDYGATSYTGGGYFDGDRNGSRKGVYYKGGKKGGYYGGRNGGKKGGYYGDKGGKKGYYGGKKNGDCYYGGKKTGKPTPAPVFPTPSAPAQPTPIPTVPLRPTPDELPLCSTVCGDVTPVPVGGDIFECSVPAGGTKKCQKSNASSKEAFIREFTQQQYDCTTCGLTSTDTTCPLSCRSLGPGKAFDTNKCLVGVKGTYDAKNPKVVPTANQPALDAVQGFCCTQATSSPQFAADGSCSCVGGTPCVKSCGQGGPCFATGDPPVGCAFKGSTPPQCNKQTLSVGKKTRYYSASEGEEVGALEETVFDIVNSNEQAVQNVANDLP